MNTINPTITPTRCLPTRCLLIDPDATLPALEDAINERLEKASATVVALSLSVDSEEVKLGDATLKSVLWTVEGLLDEARALHGELWDKVRPLAKKQAREEAP